MGWVLSFARFKEVSAHFSRALKVMFAAAAISVVGIIGFAWATHPEPTEPAAEPAVADKPAQITVDLSDDGRDGLGPELGPKCDTSALEAVAIGGDPDALDVIADATRTCKPVRFTLTPEIETYQSDKRVRTRPNPAPPTTTGEVITRGTLYG
jgi:hypothetical protein